MKLIKITTIFLSLIAVFVMAQIANADTHTWTGTTNGNWGTGTNWGVGGTPVAGDDLIFPAGASNKATNNDLADATAFNSITVQEDGYSLAGNTAIFNGNLNLTKGNLQVSTDITVYGNITIGTDVSNTGTISIDSGHFLEAAAWSTTGALTLTINVGSTLTGLGRFIVLGVDTSKGLSLNLPGAYTISVDTFEYVYAGLWDTLSTYTPTIAPATYNSNLKINSANWIASDTFNYSLAGDIIVTKNFSMGEFDNNPGVSESLSMGNHSLSVGGNFTIGTSSADTNTLSFTGGSSTLNIDGNLTIQHGVAETVTFTAPSSSGTFTLAGDYSNSATFTHNSGTLILDGASKQTLSGTMTGSSAFYNLTITNNSGASATGNERTGFVPSVDFDAAATISNLYTITTNHVRVEYNSGSTYAVNNTEWSSGPGTDMIYFRNSAWGGTWNLNIGGSSGVDVHYVNVSRSNAAGGITLAVWDGTSYDGNNNTNWIFNVSNYKTLFRFGRNVNFHNQVNFWK